ncbi:phage tail tape measure protein [Vibrio sagamiensis]|uniref:Phage tail tape measure protein domain-containing protein n=1 Tax=Vibrio sagamiensis NBRC 104589 TaxID=1219064 RepID=A0A511QLG2_9VIBR|nr:phage tail tape measure protein [Vibrio sagamiensis]PNQ69308.1 phage tail tape measure protein [Vibrio agarivorans]GEM77352.1 hypothetical protein VSA01S_34640 [Vibrio sagamiensis NBRC 104589]
MNAVDKLMMQIGLQDYATQPLKGIQKTVTQTADVSRQSWEKVAGGAATLVGSGLAVQQALMPAIEMDRVLGEVKSLGVMDQDLKILEQTALGFSSAYGKSATEVVGAAYDIKSAMGELSGQELAGVTESSAILAAATKADTAVITSYMGTLYSIFEQDAERLGKGNWAERIAGMTAKSVEKFKTTGQGMADAFKGVGALAKTHGIEIQNQMAILGMLQGSMSGSEAGTRYKAFLAGAVKAQDKLGLSFTDSNGKLLPMYDILEKIKAQFGDLDSTEVDRLKTAFGSDEAIMVVTDLIGKTDALKRNVMDLDKSGRLEVASTMAGAMTDQWERLEASWFSVRASAFGLILPTINGIAGAMADGLTTLQRYTQEYPELTKGVGYFALAVAGGAGVMGAYHLTLGAGRLAMNALQAPLLMSRMGVLTLSGAYTKAKWSLWAWNYAMLKQGVYSHRASLASKAYAASTFLVDKALMVASGGIKAFGVASLKSAAMMMANPLFWIPAAIMAVGTAAYMLISHWEDIVNTLGQWYIFQKLGQLVSWVGDQFELFGHAAMAVWTNLITTLRSVPFFNYLTTHFQLLFEKATGVFEGIALVGQGAWQVLGGAVSFFMSPFTVAWTLAKSFFSLLKDGPSAAMEVLGTIPQHFINIGQSISSGLGIGFDGVTQFASSVMDVMGQHFSMISDGIDWLIDKFSLIPGLDWSSETVDELKVQRAAPAVHPLMNPARPSVTQPISEYLQGQGGLRQSVATYIKQASGTGYTDNSQTMHTGDIVIKQEQPFTPDQLAEWQEMATP